MNKETELKVIKPKKSLAKGLVAGLVAGLAGTAAIKFGERVNRARLQSEPKPENLPPPNPLPTQELATIPRPNTQPDIRWALGGAAGAVYGSLVEFFPAATARKGAGFGMVLATLTEKGALPPLGRAEPPDPTLQDRTTELTSYALFGIVTEAVRRFVRRVL
jgi:putative membrane protein